MSRLDEIRTRMPDPDVPCGLSLAEQDLAYLLALVDEARELLRDYTHERPSLQAQAVWWRYREVWLDKVDGGEPDGK